MTQLNNLELSFEKVTQKILHMMNKEQNLNDSDVEYFATKNTLIKLHMFPFLLLQLKTSLQCIIRKSVRCNPIGYSDVSMLH